MSNTNFNDNAITNAIYPVPSSDGIFNLSKSADWTVYDLLGKKLLSGSGKKIQLASYSSKGIYFIQLDDNAPQRVILK